MTSPLQRYAVLATLLVCAISFPAPSSGLVCNQCGPGQCHVNSTTCEVPPGGRCFTYVYEDISGHNWNMMQGCVDDLTEYFCGVTEADRHVSKCCNDGYKCNENLLEIPSIKCNCIGNKCDRNDPKHCTLKSHKYSCFTELNRAGGYIAHKKGCVKNCEDRRVIDEITICCQSNKCNNHSTDVWPPPEPTTTTTTTTTTKQPDVPTTTSNPGDNPTTGSLFTTATTVQPTTKGPTIKCHCSRCSTSMKTCLATMGCLLVTIESQYITSCVNEQHKNSCRNGSFPYTNASSTDVMCCKDDYCNAPPKLTPKSSQGPPCDDEDADQSGGCDMSSVTSLTVSSLTTTASTATTSTTSSSSTTNAVNTGSTKATPTSSNEAMPTKGITAEESENEDDDSQITIIFYFFTVLLTICIIIMIVVIVVCMGLVCHYKGMAYKTVLSSSTILESALKEKGFRINSGSPI